MRIIGIVLIVGILILIALLGTGRLQSGFEAYRVLKNLVTQETDYEVDFSIDMDNDLINLSSTVQQISEDGNMIICADEYGIDVYITNGILYLENGRAFKLVGNQLEERDLLKMMLNAVRKGHVVRERDGDIDRYLTQIDSDTAEEILSLLLSENLDAVFHEELFQAEMDIQNGSLKEFHLTGEGSTTSGTGFSFGATVVPQPLSERPVIPQAVLDSIRYGTESQEIVTGEMLELVAAWLHNEHADCVEATISVNADCGVLSLDDSYNYFRQKVNGTDIHCISSHLFNVYFTDDASCTSSGQVLTTAETKLLDVAELIPIMRDLFLEGNYTVQEVGSGTTYSLKVESDKIGGIVEGIIPELKTLNISYDDCVLSVRIVDGNLSMLELNCGGSLKIVTREVDSSASVVIRYVTPNEHTIPAAVQKALIP